MVMDRWMYIGGDGGRGDRGSGKVDAAGEWGEFHSMVRISYNDWVQGLVDSGKGYDGREGRFPS